MEGIYQLIRDRGIVELIYD
jgi:hypothetical protein